MASLFIGYELDKPDTDYSDVIATIKSLGGWAHVKTSFWYLDTTVSLRDVFNKVRAQQQAQDKLIVIDPLNNSGIWIGLKDEVSAFLKDHWK